ncbi:hypothetical protein P872_24455 [Rhodonellum psychrophilum GCM71 = DSM 17998]|uniref:Uncharacterized protein n=1 Tax=Rhodonellum psychrophilum GCM71 = DSM 17998 TaxID=1123057 RepID=U5C434_9BACT|nr:hypothetical protein P872_24455 [Rhodonellum psychrophilum GCM71 = DSM 17998]
MDWEQGYGRFFGGFIHDTAKSIFASAYPVLLNLNFLF